MSYVNTDLLNALASKQSITEVFRQELEFTINLLLETELTGFLNYKKYSVEGYNSGNSRNGSYERRLNTQFGEIVVHIPRDRNGEFQNKTIPPYRRGYNELETTIIQLYQKGITTREIADLIEKMYGCHYSPQTVSNITQVIQEEVDAFHKRPLEKRYIAVFCDATYIPVRRGTVQKEAMHILLGITEKGYKEVLDYTILPNESKEAYKGLLLNLRERGVEQVSLFISDGFAGLKDACLEVFPSSKYQRCWVHISRNVRALVRKQHLANVMNDLKRVYRSFDIEEAQRNLATFFETWGSLYPKLANMLYDVTDLFTFYAYPATIRSSIYSTNLIECINKHFKRAMKHKEQFPNESSLDRFAYAHFSDYNANYFEKVHRGFAEIQVDVDTLFEM